MRSDYFSHIRREAIIARDGLGCGACDMKASAAIVELRLLRGLICVCGVRGPLCCGAPPQGLCNAPHDSGMCWKQFMMCLEGRILALAHISSLDTDLTRNTRAPHFTPQHWLLCRMGLY